MKKLQLSDGNFIAYHQIKGKENSPHVLFLGGFMSDMNGTKAVALEAHCKNKGYHYTRFDYFGHGESSGQFVEGTISRWKEDCLAVLDQLTTGKQIVIGSSMGGWLMLLTALARPERLQALIGIAAAPDFTEDLIWNELEEKAKQEILTKGVYQLPSDYSDCPYPISKALIEDGRNHLLLNNPINIDVPVHLIHGKKDEDVPYILSEKIKAKLTSDKVELSLIEEGDHRMSTPENIALLCNVLDRFARSGA